MNKGKLKSYAPKARREFIQAVTDRAGFYGLTKTKTVPMEEKGDFVIIAGQAFPKQVKNQRQALEERIVASTFDHVMEEIAYTWFNRFVAIRYMELHGYLSHGYRVLSHPEPENSIPEILEKAQYVDLPGLNKERVIELKMDGTKDEELYRMLLIAQCNELNKAMPFLFESIKDCTELLLPDRLLHSDSLIRKLVNEIDAEDWQQVEIIGWLYQFYISEKKDEVIGSVVKSEDIPAATQLFTPNWIVKYLVQNSLGSQWMRTYPDSTLKSKMEYYIEPAQQTPEVQKQLKEITPDTLNPEELTILDPACGSGHILVEAYDLLKEIYLERGYRKRDIPELILKKNLFGLEIDDRAAQLAGFAVMMKARADDRGLFDKKIEPHIASIQESHGLDVQEIVRAINAPLTEKEVDQTPASLEELQKAIDIPLFSQPSMVPAKQLSDEEKLTVNDLKALLGLFEHGKTFGSLIRIPEKLAEKLPAIAHRVQKAYTSGQPFAQAQAAKVRPFIQQAMMMAYHYDAVVANPPYMGSGYLNAILKKFMKDEFEGYEKDLFSAFIIRNRGYTKTNGLLGFMSPFVWMFISSHEELRTSIINTASLTTLIQLEYSGFAEATVPICTFTFANSHIGNYTGSFIRLSDFRGAENQAPKTLEAIRNKDSGWFYSAKPDDFKKIPGSPIAYWASESLRNIFSDYPPITKFAAPKKGMMTGDNARFLRLHWEVSHLNIFFGCSSHEESKASILKWYPHNKGGEFRKWHGNEEFVVNFFQDGVELKRFEKYGERNPEYYFKEGICWTKITSATFSARYSSRGHLYDDASCMCPVYDSNDIPDILGALNSKVGSYIIKSVSQTLNFSPGEIAKIPLAKVSDAFKLLNILLGIAKKDWNSFETSWDFSELALISNQLSSLKESYAVYQKNCREMTAKMKELEEENNRLFIKAYGLQDELTPDVPEEQITLFANPKYRYGGNLTEEELENRFKEDTIQELISYSVGCMMGRYSLDEPGLVYAHSGNEGFDSSKYKTFKADEDGIIPITDIAWFKDDAAQRFFGFIETVWGKETLEENLDFAAQSLGQKTSESSRDAIRRYFSNEFFKDHLKRYKKRPIYWLFTSGREKAFQCLVYLHRYNEGTLSRMRTEYVIPLQGMIRQRIEHLTGDAEHASSAGSANKIRKEIKTLQKQAEELRLFDEQLRHYADLKIRLDLDDGVKVNYGKFGDLLAEVKAITGSKEED